MDSKTFITCKLLLITLERIKELEEQAKHISRAKTLKDLPLVEGTVNGGVSPHKSIPELRKDVENLVNVAKLDEINILTAIDLIEKRALLEDLHELQKEIVRSFGL